MCTDFIKLYSKLKHIENCLKKFRELWKRKKIRKIKKFKKGHFSIPRKILEAQKFLFQPLEPS